MSAGSSAFSTDDTIAAIATPGGRGALGIVRISGPHAAAVAERILTRRQPLVPRYATYSRIRSTDVWPGDEVVVTYFESPRSFTGEDVVEIAAHGSPLALSHILDALRREGARPARPGEFSLRAFLNGRLDLVQAEAIDDLISALTPLQARVAFDQLQGTLTGRIAAIDQVLFDLIAQLEASLDFPDEGYHFADVETTVSTLDRVVGEMQRLLAHGQRGRMIREGAQVVITGRTNVGKSSIFNYLAGSERAIVTDIAGTTRDLITEVVDVCGVAVTLVDTAGFRASTDPVEQEGMKRAAQAHAVADLIVVVLDRSEPLRSEDLELLEQTESGHRLIVANKSDLTQAFTRLPSDEAFITASIRSGEGLPQVREAIARELTGGIVEREPVAVSNARHIGLLEEALASLESAVGALREHVPEEFVLSHLQTARLRFDEVVGARTTDDLLARIFERFCIGK